MDKSPNYEAIIIALIEHFAHNEGTDYLANKGEVESDLDASVELSENDYLELTRLRDIARTNFKWPGY